jgi:hypothetical protein
VWRRGPAPTGCACAVGPPGSLGDQRRDDDRASVAQAELVVGPGVRGRLDCLLAEPVAHGVGEPGGDLVGRDVELAGVGLESALVAGGVGVVAAGVVRRVIARVGERLSAAAARPRMAASCSLSSRSGANTSAGRWKTRRSRAWPSRPAELSPHDVLAAELDRLADAGGLPASARPGAEFVIWVAMHGLAVLTADGLVRPDSPQAIDREAGVSARGRPGRPGGRAAAIPGLADAPVCPQRSARPPPARAEPASKQ